jgi:hypothetical protein
MTRSLPDDWGCHYVTCERGHRWHLSEGYCVDCYDRDEKATIGQAIQEHVRNVANPDPTQCGCHGVGWILSSWDTWSQCPAHPGRPHPEMDPPDDVDIPF